MIEQSLVAILAVIGFAVVMYAHHRGWLVDCRDEYEPTEHGQEPL